MLSPSQHEEELVSPRSDHTDSTQQEWCVVSPEPGTQAAPSRASTPMPGLVDEEEHIPSIGEALARDLERDLMQERQEHDAHEEAPHDASGSGASTPKSIAGQDDGSDESQQRFFQTQAYAADFQRAAQASHPKRANFSSCFRLLVAGAPSTGKTTFIQNFASSCSHQGDADFGAPAVSSAQQLRLPHTLSSADFIESFSTEPTRAEEFKANSDNLCTRVTLIDEAAKIQYHVTIQDTPGFHETGQDSNSILEYIDGGNADYMHFEQSEKRNGPMTNFEDTRVDVCLYFIAPHNLRPVDIAMIYCIGQRVPVVPVIGKGDSMTKEELEQFREQISRALKIGAIDSAVYTFAPELLKEAGMQESTQVFSVISSCMVDSSVGVHWPVRNYPWGFAEALNSVHSDAPALKRLLIELSFDDLKKITDHTFYTCYRPQQLKEAQERAAAERAEQERKRKEEERKRRMEQMKAMAPLEDMATLVKESTKNGRCSCLPAVLMTLLGLLVVATVSGALISFAARPYTTRLSAACPDWNVIFYGNTPSCKLPASYSGQQAPVPPKTCLSTLNMAALQSPKQSRNKELWSLINLGRALGSGRADNPLCPQERGAVAYQTAMAQAELEKLERSRPGIKQFPAVLRSAIRKKALSWQRALSRGAAVVGQSVKATAQRVADKMPIHSDDNGKMIVDVKALKRVMVRCGVMGLWL